MKKSLRKAMPQTETIDGFTVNYSFSGKTKYAEAKCPECGQPEMAREDGIIGCGKSVVSRVKRHMEKNHPKSN